MTMMKRYRLTLISLFILWIIALGASLAHAQNPEAWEEQGAVLVGRISHIEGELSLYDPESDQWIATPQEAPFGAEDLLLSGAKSKAEFIMPNNTWARIDGDTQIQLVTLDPKLTELDLSFGNARLFNRSTKTEIKATTPFGHVTAPPGAIFDLYTQENGVEVMAIKGSVYFMHNTFTDALEVRPGSSAIFADMNEVTAAPGEVKYAWNNWNSEMDSQWTARINTKGESAAYLPPELHSEAYPLDRCGVWEKVYYEDTYYRFWRPHHISAGWAPFTSGAWIVWHGDHVWVPHESFGYVTHHYGNWIFTAGLWYWAPPVTRVTIRAHRSLLRIGFGWYPGRVAWIHAGAHLGWIPLAPNEPYYTHRHWGRRSIVVTRGTKYRRHASHRYKHRNHAVVIHRSHLYRSSNYRHARIRNIPRGTIRKNFRTTPVLNATVVKDVRSLRKKDRFRTAHKTQNARRSSKMSTPNSPKRLTKTPSHQRNQRGSENSRLGRQKADPEPGRIHRGRKQGSAGNPLAIKTNRERKRQPDKSISAKAPHPTPKRIKSPRPNTRKAQSNENKRGSQRKRAVHVQPRNRVLTPAKPNMNGPRYPLQFNSQKRNRVVEPQPNKGRPGSLGDGAVKKNERSTSSGRTKWRHWKNPAQDRTNRATGRHRSR
jgi:hypothetical protein